MAEKNRTCFDSGSGAYAVCWKTVSQRKEHILNVDEEDNRISIDLAVQTAVRFGISKSDAEDYAEDILKIIRDNWEKTAVGYGLTRRQIEEMRPAFSACYK